MKRHNSRRTNRLQGWLAIGRRKNESVSLEGPADSGVSIRLLDTEPLTLRVTLDQLGVDMSFDMSIAPLGNTARIAFRAPADVRIRRDEVERLVVKS